MDEIEKPGEEGPPHFELVELSEDRWGRTVDVRADPVQCADAIEVCRERIATLAAAIVQEMWHLRDLGVEFPSGMVDEVTIAVWRGQRRPTGIYVASCERRDKDDAP